MAQPVRLAAVATLAALLLAPSLAAPARAQQGPPLPGDPVLPGVFRLGPDAATAFEPLNRKVGAAQVVGLGEAIHTSGGFHTLRDRAIRYMVEEMGFRAVAIEDNPAAAESVNRYVQTCGGTVQDAMRPLFAVWESAELASLVHWMCEWNRENPRDRVHFFGFDVQQPEVDGPALIAFLRRTGLADEDPLLAGIRECEGVVTRRHPQPTPEPVYRRCVEALDAVERLFTENPGALVRHTSQAELEDARSRRDSLRAYEDEIFYFFEPRGIEVRDLAMARRFEHLRQEHHPGLRTVIWAHNLHVSRGGTLDLYGFRTMGSFLAESLPHYVAIGLLANELEIDWPGTGCGPSFVYNGPFSIEGLLSGLGQGDLFVDLSFPGGDPPLMAPGEYLIAANQLLIPAETFDALFFLEHSPAMTPLNRPACR